MPLPTPSPALRLSASEGAKTTFLQEGTGFTNATTVTIVEVDPPAGAAPYTFTAAVTVQTPRRLLVTATCGPVPDPKRATAKVKVTAKTGTTEDDTGPVPVVLRTRQRLVVNPAKPVPQQLRRKVNKKSVVFLPVTGLEADATATISLPDNQWKVVRLRQDGGLVRLVLKCLSVTKEFVPTFTLIVTLIGDDDDATELPVEVTYLDPDDEPDEG